MTVGRKSKLLENFSFFRELLDGCFFGVYYSNMHLNELAKLMRTVGEENRLKILCMIFDRKKACVSDIAKQLNMNIAVVSHHLQSLSQNDLILPTREGKYICYALKAGAFMDDLKKFICKYK